MCMYLLISAENKIKPIEHFYPFLFEIFYTQLLLFFLISSNGKNSIIGNLNPSEQKTIATELGRPFFKNIVPLG